MFNCQIKNSIKNDNFSFQIKNYPDSFREISQEINLKFPNNCWNYGCTFILTCEIKSNDNSENFEIKWLKEGKKFNESSLIIENFTEKNLGIYTCLATKNNRIQSNLSVVLYDKNGSIEYRLKNIQESSNKQELDERLRYLFRSKELRLGSSFAIECLDLCNQLNLIN